MVSRWTRSIIAASDALAILLAIFGLFSAFGVLACPALRSPTSWLAGEYSIAVASVLAVVGAVSFRSRRPVLSLLIATPSVPLLASGEFLAAGVYVVSVAIGFGVPLCLVWRHWRKVGGAPDNSS